MFIFEESWLKNRNFLASIVYSNGWQIWGLESSCKCNHQSSRHITYAFKISNWAFPFNLSFIKKNVHYCVCKCMMYVCTHTSHSARMEIREQLSEWVLSFYFYIDSGDWTQTTILAWQACLSTEPYFWPLANILVLPVNFSAQTWSFYLETLLTPLFSVAISCVMSRSLEGRISIFFSTISLLLLAVFLGIPFAESEFPVLDLLREKGD